MCDIPISKRVLGVLAGPDGIRLGPVSASIRRRQSKDRQDRKRGTSYTTFPGYRSAERIAVQ
jgi:hypothetical protein